MAWWPMASCDQYSVFSMKEIIISVTVAVTLMLAAMFFTGQLGGSNTGPARPLGQAPKGDVQNVFSENGKQVIEINARGGYSPQLSVAKAGVPTIIRMKTAGTFDCSSSLSIPSLGVRLSLPSSGTKDIDVSPEQAVGTLSATCAMGMYNFQVQFQ